MVIIIFPSVGPVKGPWPCSWPGPRDLWLLLLLFISLSPLYSHLPHAGQPSNQPVPKPFGQLQTRTPDPGNDSYSYSHYQSMVGDSDVATATATFSCWRHKNISALQQSGADARRDTETIDFGTCIRCEHPALVLRCHVDPYRARSHWFRILFSYPRCFSAGDYLQHACHNCGGGFPNRLHWRICVEYYMVYSIAF